MNLAPFFNAQFIDDDGTPLAGGFLHTYLTGTVTPQATYQDQAGATTNSNPIELDAAGRCDLWLTPGVEYTLLLKRADLTTVDTWDDVAGTVTGSGVVTSVNEFTGDVELTADDIPFTTGTTTDWFVGTDVGAALDSIITHSDNAIPAASVTIADAGSLYTATNVEAALQEVRAAVTTATAGVLPSQTGNSGKYLTTNGTAASWAATSNGIPTMTGNSGKYLGTDGTTASWQVAPTGTSTQATNGTITFPGGLIMKWGTTSTIPADDATNAVTFPTAFPVAIFAVTVSASSNPGIGGGEAFSLCADGWTTAGFNIVNDSAAVTATWIAIGN